jgi:hypothetical protein
MDWAKWLRWERGRQNGGYDKLLIAQSQLLKFDLYVLRFPEGAEIKPHTDPVKTGRHFRLNVIVKAARRGGEFVVKDAIVNRPRVKFFRPDVSEHSVTRIEEGSRYVISFGYVRPDLPRG